MAPLRIGTLHYVEAAIYKAEKAMVAARFNNLEMMMQKFDAEKDAKKPDIIAKNPTGKVPFLETDKGCIFTSNAIARYVARCRADTHLYGKCFNDEGQIDTWLEFCTHELEVPLMTWVYPVLGLMEDLPNATTNAQADVKKALATLEEQLKKSDFLVGDFLSLADITIVCALREGFARVFDPNFRKPYPKVCAWFNRCCGQEQFKNVFGEVKMCTQAEKPKPVPVKEQKKEQKKDEKKAEPKAKAAPAPAAKPAAAAAPASGASQAELDAVVQGIKVLKEKLKAEGVTGKKMNEHPEVKAQVEKMNELRAALAAAPAAAAPAAAAPAAPAPAASGATQAELDSVVQGIKDLKEKLKAEGVTGKKMNEHPEVKAQVEKMNELRAALAAAPAAAAPAAPAPAAAAAPTANGGDLEADVKAVGDEIRILKERLKSEGLSGKKINDHEEIKPLVAKLQTLKKQMEEGGSAAPAAPAAKEEPKAAPPAAAAAPAGDIAAQVQEVGDQIKALKAQLKESGMSGAQINKNDDVKNLVTKLQELKAQM